MFVKFRHIPLVFAAMILPVGVLVPAQAGSSTAREGAGRVGPSWPYTTVLNGQFGPVAPMKNQAMITQTEHGYRYHAGQQDSRLKITRVESGLRFHDKGTREWKSKPAGCQGDHVEHGVAAICPVPSSIDVSNPMLLEVWPRLGDDFVDGSTLSAPFQMAVLADDGRDTVLTGAGHDFVNGAMRHDVVRGGDGDDWIRTGIGPDDIQGGAGGDKLVGDDGRDIVRGDDGTDSVYGGSGQDLLYADDASVDVVNCGSGRDKARADRTDRDRDCETLNRP